MFRSAKKQKRIKNKITQKQTGSLQISFPHWLRTSPQLFSSARLCLSRFEQSSSKSVPKSNSEIVILPVFIIHILLFILLRYCIRVEQFHSPLFCIRPIHIIRILHHNIMVCIKCAEKRCTVFSLLSTINALTASLPSIRPTNSPALLALMPSNSSCSVNTPFAS